MKNRTCCWQVTLSKFDEICPVAIPSQSSTILKHKTELGENPFIFTQVIIQKRKYGYVECRKLCQKLKKFGH